MVRGIEVLVRNLTQCARPDDVVCAHTLQDELLDQSSKAQGLGPEHLVVAFPCILMHC